jgi:hypothetical protein
MKQLHIYFHPVRDAAPDEVEKVIQDANQSLEAARQLRKANDPRDRAQIKRFVEGGIRLLDRAKSMTQDPRKLRYIESLMPPDSWR